MTVTLAHAIGPTDFVFTVRGDVTGLTPGICVAVEDEAMHLSAFDFEEYRGRAPRRIVPTRWRVQRGMRDTEAVSHAAGTIVHAIRSAIIVGDDLDPPSPVVTAGGPHDHDADYSALGHSHAAGDHPDLAAHTTLGLAASHAHPYAGTAHGHAIADTTNLQTTLDGKAATHAHPYEASGSVATHAATPHAHPDLATHTGLGLAASHAHPYAADDHTHAGGSHPDLATHDALGLATDAALAAHTHDAAYEASGAVATHAAASNPHPTYLTAAEGDAAYSATGHSHPGGSEAFPVGSLFFAAVSTNPATLLGYGTWSAWGVGRFVLGTSTTAEVEAGSATHSHAFTQPNAHTDVPTHTHTTDSQGAHVHDEYRNGATTGGLDGWGAGDTSTNNPTLTGYDTGSAGGHTHTANAPAGAVSSQPHAGGAVTDGATAPPSITAFIWKRTA